MTLMDIQAFQADNDLAFRDVTLLEEAFTHRSYLNEQDDETLRHNERLEFLGDAVLDLLVTDLLFRRYPDMPEGDLTRLRAALVRTETLADIAAGLGIGEMLRMGHGEAISGGRARRNNLCGAFEALLGALYIDQGIEAVKDFVIPRLTPLLEHILTEGLHMDARSALQEWSQAVHNVTPVYRIVEATGPDHDKDFTIEVVIGDTVIATGSGKSKQTAAQAAARAALRRVAPDETV